MLNILSDKGISLSWSSMSEFDKVLRDLRDIYPGHEEGWYLFLEKLLISRSNLSENIINELYGECKSTRNRFLGFDQR